MICIVLVVLFRHHFFLFSCLSVVLSSCWANKGVLWCLSACRHDCIALIEVSRVTASSSKQGLLGGWNISIWPTAICRLYCRQSYQAVTTRRCYIASVGSRPEPAAAAFFDLCRCRHQRLWSRRTWLIIFTTRHRRLAGASAESPVVGSPSDYGASHRFSERSPRETNRGNVRPLQLAMRHERVLVYHSQCMSSPPIPTSSMTFLSWDCTLWCIVTKFYVFEVIDVRPNFIM